MVEITDLTFLIDSRFTWRELDYFGDSNREGTTLQFWRKKIQ